MDTTYTLPNGRETVCGDAFTTWERITFECYLLIVICRFTGDRLRSTCMARMRDMIIERRSLISLVLQEMERNPRSAFLCLNVLLTVPDSILENDRILWGLFAWAPDVTSIVRELEKCRRALLVCFRFKV